MRSSSSDRCAIVLLAAAIAACGEAEVIRTTVVDVASHAESCPSGQAHGEVTAYVVEVFRAGELPEAGLRGETPCVHCPHSEGGCERVSRSCRCVPRQAALREKTLAALSGIELGGLSADVPYCVRILALDDPDAASDPASDCACSAEWEDSKFLLDHRRLCAMSVVQNLSEATPSIALDSFACFDGQQGTPAHPTRACIDGFPVD